MNLKAAGVEVNEKNGALVVNDGQTTASHIWGAGDVTADIALVNVAELGINYALLVPNYI